MTEKVKKEQELHLHLIKAENIKSVKANRFYNSKLLQRFDFSFFIFKLYSYKMLINALLVWNHRFFDEWRKFTRSELLVKQIEIEKLKTKNKMQKFLEAAAEGRLWTEREETVNNDESSYRQNTSRSSNKTNTLRKTRSFESNFFKSIYGL